MTIPVEALQSAHGTPKAASAVLDISKFSGTVDVDIHNVSNFTATHNSEEIIQGMHDLKCTFEAFGTGENISLDRLMEPNGVPADNVVLQLSTGKTITFSGLVSGVTVDVEKIGLYRVTGSLESSGELAEV